VPKRLQEGAEETDVSNRPGPQDPCTRGTMNQTFISLLLVAVAALICIANAGPIVLNSGKFLSTRISLENSIHKFSSHASKHS
jgi:hypothetical protein